MKIKFKFLKETKTCCRFESREGNEMQTVYLKTEQLKGAGINPLNGIMVEVSEVKENAE